jgi:hypothetical protein
MGDVWHSVVWNILCKRLVLRPQPGISSFVATFVLEATSHISGKGSHHNLITWGIKKNRKFFSRCVTAQRWMCLKLTNKNAVLWTKSFARWHVDGLPCSSAESQHCDYPAWWGCMGIWHIFSKKHFERDRVDMANTFRGPSYLCFQGFVNAEIGVEPRLCYKICKSRIYQGVQFCSDVCSLLKRAILNTLLRDIKS